MYVLPSKHHLRQNNSKCYEEHLRVRCERNAHVMLQLLDFWAEADKLADHSPITDVKQVFCLWQFEGDIFCQDPSSAPSASLHHRKATDGIKNNQCAP